MGITGTSPAVVRRAIKGKTALPGTTGFAGEVDGRLVRDVLGRVPLFFERGDPTVWSHERRGLDAPQRLPAGAILDDEMIQQHWTLPRKPADPAATRIHAERIRTAIDESLDSVAGDGLAVAFSGGLDSAILAARLDGPLYTVGFPESHDVRAARDGARLLDCDLEVFELDHGMVEQAIPTVVDAIGTTNAMAVEIALPLYLLAEQVRSDGYERLALGQGADELFGGYTKVAQAPEDPRVDATTVRGARDELLETLPEQLERDGLATRAAGVDPVVPLVHDSVVETALSLPGKDLVSDRGERKWALRLAARRWLPDRIAFREKKALQYGSLLARELDRLARQNGFKRRQDDHVTQFIESRWNSV